MKKLMAVAVIVVAAGAMVDFVLAGDGDVTPKLPTLTVSCAQTAILPEEDLAVEMRVDNTTGQGLELTVCDGMNLCCVRGSHPCIDCKRCGGCSLLDGIQAGKTASLKTTYLPAGAYLGVKARVPANTFSRECLAAADNVVQLSWLLDCPGGVARSNTVQLTLKK